MPILHLLEGFTLDGWGGTEKEILTEMQSKGPALLERTHHISGSELYSAALGTAKKKGKSSYSHFHRADRDDEKLHAYWSSAGAVRASSNQLLKKPPLITNQRD